MASEPLHLIRFYIETPRLHALAHSHRLPSQDDLGYLLHAGLAAMFGELSPGTFALERSESRWLRVLAYSERPLVELHAHAQTFADPEAYRLCDWERAADKPMPATWREGQRIGFQVRVCPTVRVAKAGQYTRAGAEVDAFLAAAWRIPDEQRPERDAVYRGWLRDALARSGGASLEHAELAQFHIETLLRRTQGRDRTARPRLRKPDVTLRGALTITDPARFGVLLRRGVGRHRAFGFGMLLLQADRGAAC